MFCNDTLRVYALVVTLLFSGISTDIMAMDEAAVVPTSGVNHFDSVPDELIQMIGATLRYDTLIRVCKRWRKLFTFTQWDTLLKYAQGEVDMAPEANKKLYYLLDAQNNIPLMNKLVVGDKNLKKNFEKAVAWIKFNSLPLNMIQFLQNLGLPFKCSHCTAACNKQEGPQKHLLIYEFSAKAWQCENSALLQDRELTELINITVYHDTEGLKAFSDKYDRWLIEGLLRSGKWRLTKDHTAIITSFCYSTEFMNVLLSMDIFQSPENKEETIKIFLDKYTSLKKPLYLSIIELLLTHLTSAKKCSRVWLDNALQRAHIEKDYRLVRVLVQHKININIQNLMELKINKDSYTLIDGSVNREREVSVFVSPLMYAVLVRDEDLVHELCSLGADPSDVHQVAHDVHRVAEDPNHKKFIYSLPNLSKFALGDVLDVARRVGNQKIVDEILAAREQKAKSS